jgi:hypothetical protein
VLTLHRTPHACAGRYLGSSWGQMAYIDGRCRCPPLPSRQLQRGASARCRRPPQALPCSWFEPARMAALLRLPKHPWGREPSSVFDMSGSVRPRRANCHMCRLYKVVPTCTFEDTVKIPFFLTFLKQIERLPT